MSFSLKTLLMTLLLHCRDGEVVDAGTETNANLHHQLYYHFLGTDQSEDILCWRDPENPKHSFGGSVTHDGKVFCFCHCFRIMRHYLYSFYVHKIRKCATNAFVSFTDVNVTKCVMFYHFYAPLYIYF